MLQLQRQNDILSLLREHRELTVKELSVHLYSSPATIRRDLTDLEARGLLKRSFGGAVLTEAYTDQLPLAIRSTKHIAEKKRIAAKAASVIRAGETVFIDASTTTYFLAEHLKGIEDLSVITNNPHLCIVLSEMKIRNFCTGGEMLQSSIALVGSEAERFIGGFRADACFFSARGYKNGEISDSSKAERDVKIAMLLRSDRSYFLCDASKLGQGYPYRITGDTELDGVFTEAPR